MATPSLALFPSGRKATKLYSVLPTDGTGDFTVARAGLRNEINSDLKLSLIAANVPAFNYDAIGGCPVLNTEPQATNLITYPISFSNSYWTKSGATIQGDPSTAGSENITNGSFTTDSDWVKGTGWTIGSGVATKSAGSSATLAQSISNYTAGKTYLLTFDITGRTAGGVGVNNSGVFAGVTYVSKSENGQYKAYYYCTTTGTGFSLYADGNFDGSVDNVSAKEVQGFSAPSVDFPTSAFKLVESATTEAHWIRSLFGFTAGSYTQTIYAKQAERSVLQIFLGGQHSGTAYANFDLSNGTIPNSAVLQANIKALADGWYECSVTFTAVTTAGEAIYYAVSNSTSLVRAGSYTGDGTSGAYIFMAQVETGSAATSPTFTDITLAAEGSTTTRLADAVNRTGISSIIGQTEGTIVINTTNFLSSGSRTLALLYASGASYYQIYLTALNEVRIDVSGVFLFLGGTLVSGTQSKIAFAYKSGDFALYIDGVQIATSVSATIPASLNDLYVGNSLGGEQVGDIGSFSLYDTRLPNAELITLTT
jgi:hypothetical protein